MDDPVFEIEPAIVKAASQTTPSQGEHYERSSPTLSATSVGKCRSRSRRPPGRLHDRRPRLFDGRAEAQRRRAGEGRESAEAADHRNHHRPRQLWGPTFPELVEALPGIQIIDRSTVNAWDDPKVAAAIEATGRKKLIIAGISLEVCAAFPAITAIGKGYDAYVAVDASGTFSDTKREAGLLRMQQAGVIVSDYATLMVEILKDNARPEAAAVYGALDMPWATLVGQISKAYGKQSAAAPMNLR